MQACIFMFICPLTHANKEREENQMSDKRLYKSSVNCMICGVCGGIAEYSNIHPTLVRLAWIIFTCFGGAGVWAYIIAAIVIPK